MLSVSIVIITYNEAHNIDACIRSAARVSKDIVVVDSGSTDDTRMLAAEAGARVFCEDWRGYGYARNFGSEQAVNDWILAMDADERITDQLLRSLQQLEPQNDNSIYRFRRGNHLSGKRIRFGTPGFETVTRIYHRGQAHWDQSLVHEKLTGLNLQTKRIKGFVQHFGLKNIDDYRSKMDYYAQLSAEKYFREGRKSSLLKRISSPLFNAFKSYVLLLGFLNGRAGLTVAKMIGLYSWLKYFYLHQKIKQQSAIAAQLLGRAQAENG